LKDDEPSIESLEETEEFQTMGKRYSCSISEAFERFLIEKLIPCLDKKPGISTLYISHQRRNLNWPHTVRFENLT